LVNGFVIQRFEEDVKFRKIVSIGKKIMLPYGPTKGANLFKNTRISTRDHEEHKGANLFIDTRISATREHKGPIYLK